MTKTELFLKLAKPNKNGVSRWVYVSECMRTGKRYDAKQLGYPMSYYKGGAKHNNEEDACIGCYWYDPLEFKKHLREKK